VMTQFCEPFLSIVEVADHCPLMVEEESVRRHSIINFLLKDLTKCAKE
jgi:hypothetical protein